MDLKSKQGRAFKVALDQVKSAFDDLDRTDAETFIPGFHLLQQEGPEAKQMSNRAIISGVQRVDKQEAETLIGPVQEAIVHVKDKLYDNNQGYSVSKLDAIYKRAIQLEQAIIDYTQELIKDEEHETAQIDQRLRNRIEEIAHLDDIDEELPFGALPFQGAFSNIWQRIKNVKQSYDTGVELGQNIGSILAQAFTYMLLMGILGSLLSMLIYIVGGGAALASAAQTLLSVSQPIVGFFVYRLRGVAPQAVTGTANIAEELSKIQATYGADTGFSGIIQTASRGGIRFANGVATNTEGKTIAYAVFNPNTGTRDLVWPSDYQAALDSNLKELRQRYLDSVKEQVQAKAVSVYDFFADMYKKAFAILTTTKTYLLTQWNAMWNIFNTAGSTMAGIFNMGFVGSFLKLLAGILAVIITMVTFVHLGALLVGFARGLIGMFASKLGEKAVNVYQSAKDAFSSKAVDEYDPDGKLSVMDPYLLEALLHGCGSTNLYDPTTGECAQV